MSTAKVGDEIQTEYFDRSPYKKVIVVALLSEYDCAMNTPHYLVVDDHGQLEIVTYWIGGWTQCFNFQNHMIIHSVRKPI